MRFDPTAGLGIKFFEGDGPFLGHGAPALLIKPGTDQLRKLLPDIFAREIGRPSFPELGGMGVRVSAKSVKVHSEESIADALEDVLDLLPAKLSLGQRGSFLEQFFALQFSGPRPFQL